MSRWPLVFIVCAVSGCVGFELPASERAARELRCPQSRLQTRPRPDIDDHIVDVSGCGQIARYNCFYAKYGTDCIREPILEPESVVAPAPEPAAPAVTATTPPVTPAPSLPRTCRDKADFDANRNCVLTNP